MGVTIIPASSIKWPVRSKGKSDKKIDYFLKTPEVTVLIEIKSSRPVESARLGQYAGQSDIARKLNKGIGQIMVTNRLLQEGELIDQGLCPGPTLGLLVTLESFTPIGSGLIDKPRDIDIAVVHIDELERCIAALYHNPGLLPRLANIDTADHYPLKKIIESSDDSKPNPIIQEAWDHLADAIPTGIGLVE